MFHAYSIIKLFLWLLFLSQPGEILLTYCTDIGWTPYFPALAGVVTELGGLISHGMRHLSKYNTY